MTADGVRMTGTARQEAKPATPCLQEARVGTTQTQSSFTLQSYASGMLREVERVEPHVRVQKRSGAEPMDVAPELWISRELRRRVELSLPDRKGGDGGR